MKTPLLLAKVLHNLPVASYFATRIKYLNIVHIHAHFADIPTELAWAVSDIAGIPFSFSAHARDIYTQPDSILIPKIQASRFIVTCTRKGLDHLKRLCPPQCQKLNLCYHGVDCARFRPGDCTSSNILTVGRLVPKKGFKYLLDACRILKDQNIDFHLTIVGNGAEHDRLTKTCQLLDLTDQVSIRGHLDHAQLVEIYREAMIFVLPSIVDHEGDRDGLANVILEAMSSGLPVISTTAGAAGEIITSNQNGLLVEPENAVDLAAAIHRLLKNKKERESLAHHALNTIIGYYDANRQSRNLLKVFERYDN